MERKASSCFPSPDLRNSKTLIGWDIRKNKTCNPLYVEDSKIPTSAIAYYMVVSERKKEPAFSASLLKSPPKYARIYMMGDSRLAYARKQFGKTPKKVIFVASAGSGYRWLIGLDPTRSGGAWLRILGYLRDCDLYVMSVNPFHRGCFESCLKTGWTSLDPVSRRGDGLHYSVYTGAKMVIYAIAAADASFGR